MADSTASVELDESGGQVQSVSDSLVATGNNEPETYDETTPASNTNNGPSQQDDLTVGSSLSPFSALTVHDHYSVKIPSSALRLRSSVVHVYEQRNKQIHLEQRSKDMMTVKNVRQTSTFGLYALRATYTMVALLMSGFMFVFCFQIILYLFSDLAVATGTTAAETSAKVWEFIGTVLAVPLYVYGLASAMLLAFSFCYEVWGGGEEYIKPFCLAFLGIKSGNKSVVAEWIFFWVFLGIPAIVVFVTLFAKLDDWWTISAMVWCGLVLLLYVFFCFSVIYYETTSCLKLVQASTALDDGNDEKNEDDNAEKPSVASYWSLLCRLILIRQVIFLSGVRKSMYFVNGTVNDDILEQDEAREVPSQDDVNDTVSSERKTPKRRNAIRNSAGLCTRLTLLLARMKCRCTRWCGFYTKLDPPSRLYTLEEVLGTKSYVTVNSWSLDKIYCQMGQKSVMVLAGPSALLPNQIKSSFICALLANLFGLLIIISLLVWLDFAAGAIIIIALLVAACMFPGIRTFVVMYRLYRDVQGEIGGQASDQDDEVDLVAMEDLEKEGGESEDKQDGQRYPRHGKEDEDEGIQQIWETYRVTRATNSFCWIMFIVGVFLFFAWPLVSLFIIGNHAVASLFVVTGFLSALQIYMDPSVILAEIGSLEKNARMGQQTEEEEWKTKSRLTQILGSINQKRSRRAWAIVFAFLILVFLVMCIVAVNQHTDNGAIGSDSVLLEDFEYQPLPDMRYPTCNLKKGLGIPTDVESTSAGVDLIDYVFLANVAYLSPSVTQSFLDGWFGPGFAKDEQDIVNEFKKVATDGSTSVTYKLISFPGLSPEFGVVAIRGSVAMADWFVNAQLWSAAALAQVIRALLPLGQLFWTPILHLLIRGATFVGHYSLDQVSYYKETTKFVESLQGSSEFSLVHVTGQSLGGGLTIITGAQTGAPAIAVSGPNAMLSRLTFEPELSEDELNRLVMNVVPNRDIVPMVDDLANLYQRIECRAPENELFGCHAAKRSLCETIFTCGTDLRPALCFCSKEYGYPEPIPTGNRTFQDACP